MKRIVCFVVTAIMAMMIAALLFINYSLQRTLDTVCDEWVFDSENSISVVDTICGRKYVVAVDTITGNAKIIGPRHSMVMIKDSIPE